MMILIKNAQKVFTMGQEGILENVDILIEGTKIKAIGKDLSMTDAATVIDASGKHVYPGFIDAHCHIGLFE